MKKTNLQNMIRTAAVLMLFSIHVSAETSLVDDVRRDTEWLAGFESRVPGTAGHDKASAELYRKIRSIKGIKVWEDKFDLILPSTEKSELTVSDGSLKGKYKIYSVWPDVVRMKTTSEDGISGKLIYVGAGKVTDIPASSLRGQIAVMEMSSYKNWKNAFNMGAKAILLLGGPADQAIQPASQPLFMPRYYLPEGKLADALRKQNVNKANIICRGDWKKAEARNIYALVKPAASESNKLPPLVVVAPYDSMSVIMGLAPGADNALDAAFALNMLRILAENPPERAVLFGFIDAYSINQMGIRKMFSMLSINKNDGTRQVYEAEDIKLLDKYRDLCEKVDIVKYGKNEAATILITKYWDLKASERDLQVKLDIAEAEETSDVLEKEYNKVVDDLEKTSVEFEKLAAAGEDPEVLNKLYDRHQYRELQRCFKDYFSPAIFGDRSDRGAIKSVQRKLKASLYAVFESENDDGEIIVERDNPVRIRTKEIFEKLAQRLLYLEKRKEKNEPMFDEKLSKEWQKMTLQYKNEFKLPDAEKICAELKQTYLDLEKKQINLKFNNRLLKAILYANTPLEGEAKAAAEKAWIKIQARIHSQYQVICSQLDNFLKLDKFRAEIYKEIGQNDIHSSIFNYVIGIDLSDSGTTVGVANYCKFFYSNEVDVVRPFNNWFKNRVGSKESKENVFMEYSPEMLSSLKIDKKNAWDLLKKTFNFVSIDGTADPTASNLADTGIITSPVRCFNMKGVTLATLECLKPRLDTPLDKAELLDWRRLDPQIETMAIILNDIINDHEFNYEHITSAGFPAWRNPHGSVIMESVSETVPRTPMVGFLTTLIDGDKNSPGRGATRGIRSNEFTYTGPDGKFRFFFCPAVRDQWKKKKSVFSVDLDSTGAIVKSLSDSTSLVSGKLSNQVNLRSSPPLAPMRVVAFECRELTGPLLFDPRFQVPLSQFQIFDVAKGGKPRRYYMSIHNGQMYGLLEPDTRWQVIMRLGTAKKRMCLMNISKSILEDNMDVSDAIKTGGFSINEEFSIIPSLVSAKDFYAIDQWRINALKTAGISCVPIERIHAKTAEYLKEAEDAVKADDGAALVRSADAALATEIRAYHAVGEQADDVSRGAIFLLLLLLPFAIAMERIIFNYAKIGHQIISTIGIFVFMGGVLYSFHPAFKITAQPVIILMAFLIIFLSALVISMIFRKFESELEEMRRGNMAEASGAQTSRVGLVSSAIWLGLANMRKRKLRTTLTALTIVLITFAILCFTSSKTYQDKRIFSLDLKPSKSSVVIQHPAMRALNNNAKSNIANFLKNQYPASPRYWIVTPDTTNIPNWRLFVRNPDSNKYVKMKAGLGLSANEHLLTDFKGVLNNWDEFSKGNGCYLSDSNAEELGVKAGDTLVVAGRNLKLLNTFDGMEIEKRLKNIDGNSLLPYDYSISKDNTTSQEQLEAELATGDSFSLSANSQYTTGDDIIIVSEDFAEKMNGTIRSIGFAVPNDKTKTVAENLMRLLSFPVYYTTPEDVKVIISTPIIPQAPRNLAVPLIIAALIIFNTMLNSVAERKKEIHIYTSLGLAPSHVGMLFLAEAATYGLMGSVFGYIVGQAIAKVLTGFELMGGITLNYSGTNVIMTMGMVIAVVLLSSIVPAIMAGKVANPNKDLNWKVPQPENGVIKDLLPFTVTDRAAKGLIAFIYEYMEAHQDGSIGHFTSDSLSLLGKNDERVVGIRGTVWLDPYDLGVREDFIIEIVPDIEDICKIRIELIHRAGQERSWCRLNRIFLADVRKQLLGWRNIAPERVMKYIKEAENEK